MHKTCVSKGKPINLESKDSLNIFIRNYLGQLNIYFKPKFGTLCAYISHIKQRIMGPFGSLELTTSSSWNLTLKQASIIEFENPNSCHPLLIIWYICI